MKVLVYLGHPAQYHFFKHIIRSLSGGGHQIIVLLKSKDILEELVKQDGLSYINIQKNVRKSGIINILIASFRRTIEVIKIAKQNKVDLMIGTDASICQAAKLLGIYGVTVLEDDIEVIKKLAQMTYPFSDSIVVPRVCKVGKWEYKKVPYAGYMKLAYLHPNYFQFEPAKVVEYIDTDKYCLIRLALLTAHHDVGIKGLNTDIVLKAIEIAKKYGYWVYISSEGVIDERLAGYQLKINSSDIHHVMAKASLLISDSQSMSVESAVLGVPSIRFSDFTGRISVLDELENRYGLTYGIKTTNHGQLCEKIDEILSNPDIREVFQKRRQQMLSDKIDVTAFFTWFIENYPESKRIMKENSDYQYKFK